MSSDSEEPIKLEVRISGGGWIDLKNELGEAIEEVVIDFMDKQEKKKDESTVVPVEYSLTIQDSATYMGSF